MFRFIQNNLRTEDVEAIIDSFLKITKNPSKWILLTDYCIDAPYKANVVTFVLIHYKNEVEYNTTMQTIAKLQKSDIKHTRYISNRLMRYLKKLPIFSFSFIIDNRDKLFGDTEAEQKKTIIDQLDSIKSCFQKWLSNAPKNSIKEYYQDSIDRLDKQIKVVSQGKKIELHEDILLTTSLGAVYTAEILRSVPELEIIGWFPDRDKITQSCNEIAIPLFHCMLYNALGGRDFIFSAVQPQIKGTPFYDVLNRIPDDICAAIADFEFVKSSISKEKFSHVLHELMAENPFVRVHRLSKDASEFHFNTVYYKTDLMLSLIFYWNTMLREIFGFFYKMKNIICRKRKSIMY